MNLAVAQTQPRRGDIAHNIADHMRFVQAAVAQHADLLIFPELSLTGYEPTLARALATTPDDPRLAPFQMCSDADLIVIGVGLPLVLGAGVGIGMVLFRPGQSRVVYAKHHLHPDELPFFVPGANVPVLPVGAGNVGLAICYELSIPAHAATAVEQGAACYVAGVAKSAAGVTGAHRRLGEIARTYAMPVLMANCVGPSGDFVSTGGSAAWDAAGARVGLLDAGMQGIVSYDTSTDARRCTQI
ncbi:MAG: carbon-nitrogen hydrolase family protein [Caldilineaceae bacterium]